MSMMRTVTGAPASLAAGWLERIGRLTGSRALFLVQLLLIVVLGAGLALWLRPEPHSDWGYYWAAAGELDRYERGGLSLWLLAIPKALGWSPVASALLLNLTSAVLMLWLARSADTGRGRWLAQLVALYLLLITPYAGIVQLDLIAATQLALGFWLVMALPPSWPRSVGLALAVLMIVMGVSTRPQYALTLWAMIGLFALPWWLLRRRSHAVVPVLMGVLLLGSVGGFAVDSGLREASGRSEAVRTGSAVTLYSGLLFSHDGAGCGYWSAEAAMAAKRDSHKPLHRAVLDRLGDAPVSHWMSVVGCKLPQIVLPPPYALYWLVESPNIRARIDADPRRESINATYHRAARWERKAYGALTFAILLAVPVVCVILWRRGAPLLGLLAVAWIASFWVVHAVFEIQGRYFLGMFLLAPLLCALAIRNCPYPRSGTPVHDRSVQ